MRLKEKLSKAMLVTLLVIGISVLHFTTQMSQHHFHVVYRELYFLPLILAGFWFGMRGAVATAVTITIIYLPFTLLHWQGFSPDDLDKVLELLLYNVVAVLLGFLRDREKAREREKLEAVMAMAGSIAHELNTPLFTLIGNAQLLQSEFDPESPNYEDAQAIIDSASKMKQLIQKIAHIDQIQFTNYVGDAKIIDIKKAAK